MARPIVLSNGELHVGINRYGLVHDFYYPYVGLENHAAGKDLRHRVGVWAEGQISWLDDGNWRISFSYPHHALIGHTIAKNDALGILLEFDDTIDVEQNALYRNIHVVNSRDEARDIRLFCHQAFVIGDRRSLTDTAQYLPDSDAILHYHGRRAFVIGGATMDGKSFDQFTTGLFGIEGREGTWRDADDGELSGCAVEHGRVDSTIRFHLPIEAHSSTRVHYWIAAGRSTRGALSIHKKVQKAGLDSRYEATAKLWRTWLEPADEWTQKLPKKRREKFLRSVMLLKSHVDARGAVIASTDSAMLNYNRDAYAYCWPRDAGYVLWPLMRLGYSEEAENFFLFAAEAVHPAGYLMHKYSADGALGSSWHPYVHTDGEIAPPIQTDETAIVVFLAAQFEQLFPERELMRELYEPMIKKMADFLANYIDPKTHLPRPSYDLWEENFMTTTYTSAVTYAGLLAAAELADKMHDSESAVRWRASAEAIMEAAPKQLYSDDKKALRKGLRPHDSDMTPDDTLDFSALYGSFMYGLFPIGDELLENSFAAFDERFNLRAVTGAPRYEDDTYQRTNPASLGNPWIITTLWIAQYAAQTGDYSRSEAILTWVEDRMLGTGVLSEQVNPDTLEPVSVAPLAWSHAEYVSTLLDVLQRDQMRGSDAKT